jgi:hypothetical protein
MLIGFFIGFVFGVVIGAGGLLLWMIHGMNEGP